MLSSETPVFTHLHSCLPAVHCPCWKKKAGQSLWESSEACSDHKLLKQVFSHRTPLYDQWFFSPFLIITELRTHTSTSFWCLQGTGYPRKILIAASPWCSCWIQELFVPSSSKSLSLGMKDNRGAVRTDVYTAYVWGELTGHMLLTHRPIRRKYTVTWFRSLQAAVLEIKFIFRCRILWYAAYATCSDGDRGNCSQAANNLCSSCHVLQAQGLTSSEGKTNYIIHARSVSYSLESPSVFQNCRSP